MVVSYITHNLAGEAMKGKQVGCITLVGEFDINVIYIYNSSGLDFCLFLFIYCML